MLESKADMQKRGQVSPHDGDALALTFAQRVAPAEVKEESDEEEFGMYGSQGSSDGCDEVGDTALGRLPSG